MIEHHSVVNYLWWLARELGVTAADRVLHKTSFSFDASVEELFLPLATGATLVVACAEASESLDALVGEIRVNGVSILQVVPSMLSALLDVPTFAGCTALRAILCGAEPLPPATVRRLDETLGARLLNLYGPTETTISSTSCDCGRVRFERSVPIGRPIANTRALILDRHGGLVPFGVPGELCIGGEGLARGYLGKPALTAARFVSAPGVGEARVYRTGDLACFRSEGEIEFLGRFDDQVKIRGFRVEPGEIEATLQRLDGVREAAVVVRGRDSADRRLVAYVTPLPGRELIADQLLAALRAQLPEHMVPSASVVLDALPITANGKVDRRALPDPGAPDGGGHVAPRDALEVQVARIWEHLLARYPVSVVEDFFELGGTSLLAMRLIDRVNQVFARQLPLDVLWHGGRTVETMAAMLRGLSGEGGLWSRAVAFRAGNGRPPLFCAPIVGGHLYFYDNLARHLDADQPVIGLPARGTDGSEAPHSSIEAMAAHAISLMREVQARGPYALMGYCSGGHVALEMAQQLVSGGESVSLLAIVDSPSPSTVLRLHPRALAALARQGDWRLLQERVYHMALKPLALDRLRRFRKPGEAHRWALWSYRARPYPGRIVLFEPADLPSAGRQVQGWRSLASCGIELRTLPGAHGDLVKEPGVRLLADRLAPYLAAVAREAEAA
jgi:thioesterase domain-containing protein